MVFNLKARSIGMTALVVLLSLSLVACSVSAIIAEIEVSEAVLVIGAPVVAAFAGPGAVIAQQIMSAAATGFSCVLTAAKMPGATTSTISVAFATCFGPQINQVLPAGTPAYIATIVTAVVATIKMLVDKFGPQSALMKANPVMPIKLTHGDRGRIDKMQKQLDAIKASMNKAANPIFVR